MNLLATIASLVGLIGGIVMIGRWASRRGQFSSPETHLQHLEYAWELPRNPYHVRGTAEHTDHHGMAA